MPACALGQCSLSSRMSAPIISYEILKKMLERENALRLSDDIQRSYAEAELSGTHDWMVVTDSLQTQLCHDFGFGGDQLGQALYELRTATQRFPDLSNIPLYVRFNRARQGDINPGQVLPEIKLYPLATTTTPAPALPHATSPSDIKTMTLQSLQPDDGRCLVVFAGSIT